MTQTSQEVAVINSAMLERGSGFDREPSTMDVFHKIKMYNANTFSKNKEDHEVNPELAGKLRLVKAGTWDIEYIDSWFKANILSVCKVKSGNVFVLDQFGDPIKDEKGLSKKAFFFSNEHSVYTRQDDTLWFKQMGQKPLWFFTKKELEEMLKTKRIDWKDNPFWKQWTKKDWEPYNDTHISNTIIMYWKFIDWPFEWEFFKFVPVSLSWYGNTYKDGKTVPAEEWTFLHALETALPEWNKVRKQNGMKEVKSIDPSQVDLTINFKEVEIQNKKMYIPQFKFDNLTCYRTDNTEDLKFILEAQSDYLEEEFGIKVLPSNYRLGSIKDVNVSNVKEIKVIETKSEVQDAVIEEEIEIADIEHTFKLQEQNKPTLKWGVSVPF